MIDALLHPSDTAAPGSPSPEETKPALPPATGPEIHIPGYEIEDELGRGAMGVVYRARQTGLNRTVALKMVLGSGAADSRAVIRFLAEAEAVAAVKHPHVVQVHDFGEANGHPFMALEYLSGGCLTDVLASGRRESTILAALVGKIARGVAAAHELGIVHRDLKPANILFDAAGEPKVTDFGLAKRNSGSDLTATQAVMGTPAYMSPEQAKGDTKFVGPQGDVWALGVILYECLTGKRPFHADDVRGLLLQILTTDPVPVCTHDRTIPRDLELICLKCLSREPHERYAHAGALADDLDRFVRGEPISVRAAGPVERAAKWVRRNKVVAGAMAAVTLALVIGSGVSLAFGLEAREAAKRERGEAQRADQERDDAIEARNNLRQANVTLEQSVDDLNSALASALLAPIRSDTGSGLTLHEVNAFWGLASRRRSYVSYRFLEEATGSPLTYKQLANRGEYAFNATIGLDPDMRDKAERLLAERLNTPGLPADQQRDLALACSHLQGLSPALATRVAAVLVDAMIKNTGPISDPALAVGLAAVAGRMTPDAAAAASKTLTDALTITTNPIAQRELPRGLAALAGRMTPDAADAAAKTLTAAMAKNTNGFAMQELADGLAAVAGRMTPDAADAAAKTLTDAMAKPAYPGALRFLPECLALVAGRMTPGTAGAAAKALTDAMTKTTIPVALLGLAEGLAAVAGRMTPDAATSACSGAARTLTDAMAKTTYPMAQPELAMGLAAVAERMTPEEAAKPCATAVRILTDAMAKTTDPRTLWLLAEGLAAVAGRMTPDAATSACSGAAKSLTDAMTKTTDPNVQWQSALGLAAVAGRMTPDAAASTCTAVAKTLTEAMGKTTNPGDLMGLSMGLAAVAGHMPPDPAAKTLTDAIAKTTNPMAQGHLAESLAAVAGRMTPDAAASTCTAVARMFADEMAKATNVLLLRRLAASLAAVAGRMTPDEAAMMLTAAMGSGREPRPVLAGALRNAACGLPPLPLHRERIGRFTVRTFPTLGGQPPGAPALHPQPKPLPPQTLVDLLKHPFCVDEARRAVLDALEFTYNRKFADQWDFVQYVRDNKLPLDLLTPPKRPQRER